MATQNEFENRRRARMRKERLRRKRIRAVIILIVFIAIIVLGCTAVSTLLANKSETQQHTDSTVTEVTSTDAPEAVTDENISSETVPSAAQSNGIPLSITEKLRQTSNIPDPAEENNLLEIIAKSGEKKHCYLTFDDGPTENITPQILDTLRKYNVKATFFQVGSLIEANADIARRVYEEGHLIANHSNSHNYEKLYASEESFKKEIEAAHEKITAIGNGEEPFKLIRFPGGSYNAGDHAKEKQIYKGTLKDMGFYYCDWNSLNGDAEGKTKNAKELLEYLKQTSGGYNNLIVLMHDASTKQATADALGSIIEYLSEQGYTFHRLDDIDYNPSAAASASPNASTQTVSVQ